MKPLYKVKQLVIYKQDDSYELVVIKRIIKKPFTCIVVGSKPLKTYEDYNYSYIIAEDGNASLITVDEESLFAIKNDMLLRELTDESVSVKPVEIQAEFHDKEGHIYMVEKAHRCGNCSKIFRTYSIGEIPRYCPDCGMMVNWDDETK